MSYEVQSAVYKLLAGDADLAGLVLGGIHKLAPQDVKETCIEFGPDIDIEDGADCVSSYKTQVNILAWQYIIEGDGTRGPKQAQEIARHVIHLLHDKELPVDGCQPVELQWIRTEIINDEGNAYRALIVFEGNVTEIDEE